MHIKCACNTSSPSYNSVDWQFLRAMLFKAANSDLFLNSFYSAPLNTADRFTVHWRVLRRTPLHPASKSRPDYLFYHKYFILSEKDLAVSMYVRFTCRNVSRLLIVFIFRHEFPHLLNSALLHVFCTIYPFSFSIRRQHHIEKSSVLILL